MEASVQSQTAVKDRESLPLGATPGADSANAETASTAEAMMGGLVVLFVVTSGVVWGWVLIQCVQLFVQPPLASLQERVAEIAF